MLKTSLLFSRLADFLFPITCSGCGARLGLDDQYRICPSCVAGLPLITGLVCVHCGVPLPDGGAACFQCRSHPLRHITAIRSCVRYEGPARDIIKRFKYGNRDYLDRFLGRLLLTGFETHPHLFAECDSIVPVPLHPLRRLTRGYNQAELLARSLGEWTGKPVITDVLRRSQYSRPQFRLRRDERFKNLKDVFTAEKNGELRGKSVLLIDDVCTTGATLSYCAAALKHAGAARVYGLTVARD